jgi:acetyl-CoA carboxylase biotin carboxylase subunit
MFRKILVANRGEIAIRIIRACREMGIRTVAVYSEADSESIHAALADESYCIGSPLLADSYMNEEAILQIAKSTGADALHPGYGLLSENASFAEKCEANGLCFIGPDPDVMKRMSNKEAARKLAKSLKVPMVPGTGILKDSKEALALAKDIGYPVILKARSGGGGKGIRIVHDASEMEHAYALAYTEGEKIFGDGALYMERYLTDIKHIEVQILADKTGKVVAIGERDCSLQRKNQKLIEESPAPKIAKKTVKKLYAYAKKIAKGCGYVTVGTCEFLMDKDENVYFCEMNTRLQVEHTVTEELTGIDLVKWQIRTAAGLEVPFDDVDVEDKGAVIECRINAEDPDTFLPSNGKVELLHIPGGMGVRFDTYLYQGAIISPYYDSLLGKLIVRGRDRDEAIRKLRSALTELVITGVKVNTAMHLSVISDAEFISGEYHTDHMGRKHVPGTVKTGGESA